MLKHYFSEDYLDHLSAVTKSDRFCFLVDGMVINFYLKSGPNGAVINSNPFFGSHGGFYRVPSEKLSGMEEATLEEIILWFVENDVQSITIVENPYGEADEMAAVSKLVEKIKENVEGEYQKIERLSSVAWMEEIRDEEQLLNSYHQKTRNCLRKFQKSGAVIRRYNSLHEHYQCALSWIFESHHDGILAKGGKPKPWSYFSSLADYFSPSRFELKIAELDGEPIGGLLNFQLENQREYWTPVTTLRGMQTNAIYGLVHASLLDVVGMPNACLNFGGSWPSQTDLQRFKNRFGCTALTYNYHCFIRGKEIMTAEPTVLNQDYEFFFIRDFSQ